jgi:Uncharacterised nucleotidyltransferase
MASVDSGSENLATNLRAEAQLLRVLSRLDPGSVAVFKGPILTRRLYGDLRGRASTDQDLLLRAESAEEVLRVLHQLGFRAPGGIDARQTLVGCGQVSLAPGDGGVHLDLHLRAFSARYFSEDPDVVWGNMETIDLHGHSVLTMNSRLALAHVAAHCLSHLFDESHLEEVRRAWRTLGPCAKEEAFSVVAEGTLGWRAFEFCLRMALGDDFPESDWPGPKHPHLARLAQLALRVPVRAVTLRGAVVALTVAPKELSKVVRRGVWPSPEELTVRYGPGSLFARRLRHLGHRIFH